MVDNERLRQTNSSLRLQTCDLDDTISSLDSQLSGLLLRYSDYELLNDSVTSLSGEVDLLQQSRREADELDRERQALSRDIDVLTTKVQRLKNRKEHYQSKLVEFRIALEYHRLLRECLEQASRATLSTDSIENLCGTSTDGARGRTEETESDLCDTRNSITANIINSNKESVFYDTVQKQSNYVTNDASCSYSKPARKFFTDRSDTSRYSANAQKRKDTNFQADLFEGNYGPKPLVKYPFEDEIQTTTPKLSFSHQRLDVLKQCSGDVITQCYNTNKVPDIKINLLKTKKLQTSFYVPKLTP